MNSVDELNLLSHQKKVLLNKTINIVQTDMYDILRLYHAFSTHDIGNDERLFSNIERFLKLYKFDDLVKNSKDDLTLISLFHLLALNEYKNESQWVRFLSYVSSNKNERELMAIHKQAQILLYLQTCADFKPSTVK